MNKATRQSPIRLLAASILTMLLLQLVSTPALAANGVPPTLGTAGSEAMPQAQDLTPAEREALLARLSDEQVRSMFLELLTLNADAAAASRAGADPLMSFAEAMRSGFVSAVAAAPELADMPGAIVASLVPDGASAARFLLVVGGILAVLVFGFLCEHFYLRAVADTRIRLEQLALSLPPIKRAEPLLARYGLRLLGVAVLAAGAFLAFLVLHQGHDSVRLLMMSVLKVTVVFRIIQVTAQALLEPHRGDLRDADLTDIDAMRIYRRIVWIAIILVAESVLTSLFELAGASQSLLGLWLLGVVCLWLVLMVTFTWQIRRPIANLISSPGGDEQKTSSLLAAFGRTWHLVYSVAYLMVAISGLHARFTGANIRGAGVVTVVILLLMPAVLALIGTLIRCRAASSEPAVDEDASGTRPQGNLVEVFVRGVRILLVIGAILLIAQRWGVDLGALSQDSLGGRLVGAAVEILVAILLAYLVWAMIRRVIDPHLPVTQDTGPGDEGGGTGASRISTLMPIARKTILVVLVAVTIMVIISAMGVNIGPLLAGAGVVGLAVGFGAQTLVKDIISGAFFLMDDAFRMGEYLDIGSVKGTVERISVRSLQLRHHNGPVHTVPYGEIQHVTNFSRDWAIMKFELRIPFETDLEKVRKLIKKVGIALMDDPVFGPLLLEPVKSQGVNRMDDSALIIRCKFTAIPGQQFYVRREAFRLIQETFENNGIKFAPRRVIVESTSAAPEAAAAGAIAAAAAAASTDTAPPDLAAGDDRG